MAVTYPVMFTSIEDAEVGVERPVSDETVRKLIQNVNMLSGLAKIGQVISVAVNQIGVPAPQPNQFQQCDGTEITQENSPLQSTGGFDRFTPQLEKFFIRGAPDESSNFQTDAELTNDLSHTHSTGTVHTPNVGEEGDERHGYDHDHNHGVDTDLSAAEPIDPAHMKVVFYLKIN
jgi:hypothetical protein